MTVIDSHQHFWHYQKKSFEWIDDSMAAIRRDFLPGDLAAELEAWGVNAAVAVQARQELVETEWLLDLASTNHFLAGVVGWIPLVDSRVEDVLDEMGNGKKLIGVRHVVQDETDPHFLERSDFNRGLALLHERNLRYDLLIRHTQLASAIGLVDRHPRQIFILDHAAKPPLRSGSLEPWKSQIRELAKRSQVAVKLSGLVTETDRSGATAEKLKPWVETLLESFGPRRILFGSDWPVCLVHTTYGEWIDLAKRLLGELSPSEKEAVLGVNAVDWYGLKIKTQVLETR